MEEDITTPDQRVGFQKRVRTFLDWAQEKTPPSKKKRFSRIVYGFAQPLIATKNLFQDKKLLQAGLLPAFVLAVLCFIIAFTTGTNSIDTPLRYGLLERFYETFVVLAVVPPFLFARHYAKMASLANNRLGFPLSVPLLRSLSTRIKEVISQIILISFAIAPILFVIKLFPKIGVSLGTILAAFWSLYWIVIEALDNARVLPEGISSSSEHEDEAMMPFPWFVRFFLFLETRLPWIFGSFSGWFAKRCQALSRHWHKEIALIEQYPWLALGFSLGTALLIATPVLGLLFRPIIIIASVKLLAQLSENIPFAKTSKK